MYVIEVKLDEEPAKKSSLIDDIKNLNSVPTNREDSDILMTSIRKKKKKEKKKKKKQSTEIQEILDDIPEIEADQASLESRFLDIDELFLEEREEDIAGEIIGEQSRNYNKLKKDENPYKKEFAEELTLLYNLLDETDKNNKLLDKQYREMTSSKTRGVSKYGMDLASCIQQGKTTKLHIIKEIVSTKKTMADLKLKSDSKNKDDAGSQSNEILATTYLQNILNHGRSEFIDTVKGRAGNSTEIGEWSSNEDSTMFRDQYNALIDDRLVESGYQFNEEGDKYIEYEHLDITLCIKKCIDTGEWEIIAIDRDGQQVFDYPTPKKSDLGTMKFTDDGTYATDKFGRSYKVHEYISNL